MSIFDDYDVAAAKLQRQFWAIHQTGCCQHEHIKSFCHEPNTLPRIVLRQCTACLFWWRVYGQECEPSMFVPEREKQRVKAAKPIL